ncbi:hypothetical protein MNBD_UNCLBAC01-574 [hydrothermal vent metagenome]|uniref:Uncharacterized protein n=1 Tax=hydrothermal vent metagenome TaxID=652676 RepID=A0A3B1D7D0_9ZZZZ
MKKLILTIFALVAMTSSALAGGFDEGKGLDKITLKGTLVCLGCSLKKLSGANAQCSLYSQHEIGFKAADGTLWSIVDNAVGHDIINAHELVAKKDATIVGWIYPVAHFIEIASISVDGVSKIEIQKAGLAKDQLKVKKLAERTLKEVPKLGHSH